MTSKKTTGLKIISLIIAFAAAHCIRVELFVMFPVIISAEVYSSPSSEPERKMFSSANTSIALWDIVVKAAFIVTVKFFWLVSTCQNAVGEQTLQ